MKSKLLILLSLFAFVGGVKAQTWSWTPETFTAGKAYYFQNKQHKTYLGVSKGNANMCKTIDDSNIVAWKISANSNATFSSENNNYFVNDGKIGTTASRTNFSVEGSANEGYEVSYTTSGKKKYYIYCNLLGSFGQSTSAQDNYRDWLLYSVNQKEMRDSYVNNYNQLKPQAEELVALRLSSEEDKSKITTALNNAGSASMTDYEQKINALRSAITTCTANNETKIAALTSAIADKDKSASLGFLAGEYAPYNNVNAIAALNAAKAIDVNGDPAHQTVVDATTALNNATWTANTAEVNAIYNGTFEGVTEEATSNEFTPQGWTQQDGIRKYIVGSANYEGLSDASNNSAVFMWGGTTATYGEQDGFTMPLKANTAYVLSLKSAGWTDGDLPNNLTATITGSNDYVVSQDCNLPTKRIGESNSLVTTTFTFTTGEAGDYVFALYSNHHVVFTDVTLYTAKAEDLTYTRDNLTIGSYGTICLPYAVSAANFKGAALYKIAGKRVDENGAATSIVFDEATDLEAGVPYIFIAEDTKITATYTLGAKATAGKSENGLQGTLVRYAFADDTNYSEGEYYVINSNNEFQKASKNSGASANRAFVKISQVPVYTENEEGAQSVKVMRDNLETGLNAVEVSNTRVVYDLQGRRVNNPANGLYIVNGKKVYIK